MDTLNYILKKYKLNPEAASPLEIPDMGRDQLAELFAELGFTNGAEIGIEQGVYSEILCKANPALHLTCVDPWLAYKGYRDHVTQSKLDGFYQNTLDRLAPYNVTILRKTSMDALADIPDKSLDFVYIDANHEIPWTVQDICWWRGKVRKGGIISGHDFYRSKRLYTKCHVVASVLCAVESYRINPWFLVGLKAKLPGLIRDTSRSWFWIND